MQAGHQQLQPTQLSYNRRLNDRRSVDRRLHDRRSPVTLTPIQPKDCEAMPPPLAQSIAADRKRLGMSQEELARQVGVTQQSVAKWEGGDAAPRGKRLTKLVQALGKKSQTADVLETMLGGVSPRGTTMGQFQAPPMSQAQALVALARAAQDLALAAQAIAESVKRIAGDPTEPTTPPTKSPKH